MIVPLESWVRMSRQPLAESQAVVSTETTNVKRTDSCGVPFEDEENYRHMYFSQKVLLTSFEMLQLKSTWFNPGATAWGNVSN